MTSEVGTDRDEDEDEERDATGAPLVELEFPELVVCVRDEEESVGGLSWADGSSESAGEVLEVQLEAPGRETLLLSVAFALGTLELSAVDFTTVCTGT